MNRVQFIVPLCAIFCLNISLLWAEAIKPDQFIQDNIKKIISIVLETKGEKKFEIRRQKIKNIFVACFDLPRLAGMTLGGTQWKKLSLEQKKLYTEKYAEFVLSFYIGKLDNYNNNKIEISKSLLKSGGKRATVNTRVEFEGKMAKIDYSLTLMGDKWRIYDVEVEGVRLSTTYRTQFQSILRKNSFDGLIAEIDKLIVNQLKT